MKRRSAALVCCLFLTVSPAAAMPAAVAAPLSDSSANAFWAAFAGALLGELVGKTVLHRSAQKELTAEAELQRQRLTREDESNIKQIATALEEYSVDNGGNFPATLAQLEPLYLRALTTIIPRSNPVEYYTYERPPKGSAFGAYLIKDNGKFDPTLDELRNANDLKPCTKDTCTYIIYSQNSGLLGL